MPSSSSHVQDNITNCLEQIQTGKTHNDCGENLLYTLGCEFANLINEWTQDEYSLVSYFHFYQRYLEDQLHRKSTAKFISDGISDTGGKHESYLRVLLHLDLDKIEHPKLISSIEWFVKENVNECKSLLEVIDRYTVSYAFLPFERYIETYMIPVLYSGKSDSNSLFFKLNGRYKPDPYLFLTSNRLGERMLNEIGKIFRPLHLAEYCNHILEQDEFKNDKFITLLNNAELASCEFSLSQAIKENVEQIIELNSRVMPFQRDSYTLMRSRIATNIPPLLEYSTAYVRVLFDNTSLENEVKLGKEYQAKLFRKYGSWKVPASIQARINNDLLMWKQRSLF
jgi:hypothetical protein